MWQIRREDALTVLAGKSEGNEPEDPGVHSKIIIKRIVHKNNWLGIGTSGGLLLAQSF
jgi:hypothetical protein